MTSRAAPRAPSTTQPSADGRAQTLPAGGRLSAASHAPHESRRIVVLSEDSALLEAVTCAARERATVIASPSFDRFADQLVADSAQIALIDAAAAPAPLQDFIATLRAQFPQMLLLVAGPAPRQPQLAEQLADGSVFRFVHKPASAKRLQLFVDAALQHQAAQTDDQTLSARSGGTSDDARRGSVGPAVPPPRRFRAIRIALAVLAAAVLLCLQAPIGDAPAVIESIATAIPADSAVTSGIVHPTSSLRSLKHIQPAYPPDALERGIAGRVNLEFTVTPAGTVEDIQVQSAEPRGVFEQAAISALSQSLYEPLLRHGVAVASRAHVTLRFTL